MSTIDIARSPLLGTVDSDEPRNLDIRLRVSASEKNEVQQAASEAGLTVSDYIRRAIGLSRLKVDQMEEEVA
jgi:predicted DNA binding CopG/RHH family protein